MAKPPRLELPTKRPLGSSATLELALVILGQAYPADHAPWVEVARGLAGLMVTRHQHDDAPIVDVLQVDGGSGAKIARERFRGLDHHLLADPRLRDISFQLRGAWPLPIHHSFLL